MRTGQHCATRCAGQPLHSTTDGSNPYKSVIEIVSKTLGAFDDDHLIPMYGFGDVTSKDHSLVSFDPHDRPIHTLENVLQAYTSQINSVNLSGPTSFAPAIWKGIDIVRKSRGGYHILLIIADGQVSGGACMTNTLQAISEASNYPMSIVIVGVGDGPFGQCAPHIPPPPPPPPCGACKSEARTQQSLHPLALSIGQARWNRG